MPAAASGDADIVPCIAAGCKPRILGGNDEQDLWRRQARRSSSDRCHRRVGAAGLRAGPAFAQATQGVTDNEILIGALGQLSGPFAFIGAPGRDNMQLAIDKINEAGPINGRKLRMIFEHAVDAGRERRRRQEAQRERQGLRSGDRDRQHRRGRRRRLRAGRRIPTYNTVGATPIIRNPFARNVFHGTITDAGGSGQGMIDIAFRAVPNATKIGVLAGTYAFPQSHLAEIQPRLAKRGGVEVVVEQFDAAARDYTAQLISFARQRVQAVLILGSFTEAGFAIKQAPERV